MVKILDKLVGVWEPVLHKSARAIVIARSCGIPWLVPVALAVAATVLTDLANGVPVGFYAVLAVVLAIVGPGALLAYGRAEAGVLMRMAEDPDDDPIVPADLDLWLTLTLARMGVFFCMGEGACLAAVALDHSSPFLFVLSTVPAVILVGVLFAGLHGYLFSISNQSLAGTRQKRAPQSRKQRRKRTT